MALIEGSKKNNIFLSIVKGSLERTIYAKDAEGKILKNAAGKSVVESKNKYPGVDGRLTSIAIREIQQKDAAGQIKKFSILSLNLADGDDNYIVSVNMNSNEAESIIYALDSVKSFAGKKLTLKVYMRNADNGKSYSTVSITLGTEKVGWSVAPKDRPALKPVVVNGTQIWDRTDRLDDMKARLDRIQELLKSEVTNPITVSPQEASESDVSRVPHASPIDNEGGWENDDNMPF